MKKIAVMFLAFAVCGFFTLSDVQAKKNADVNNVLNELMKELSKGGISHSDLKNVNKELENMLKKGGNKQDIQDLMLGMSKHGIAGKDLKDSVGAWNDLLNAGAGHKNSADALSQVLQNGKKEGLHGNNLAAMIQNALRQRQGHYGKGGSRALDDLVAELERNGATQQDLRNGRDALQNILGRGGSHDATQAILLDMIRNGVTGTYFIDSLNAWNDAGNRGADNQRLHDILSQTLHNSKAKGMKDKELAAAIQEALRNTNR